MLGTDFYNDTMKKYIILFGMVFADVKTFRLDKNGKVVETLKVPISYGPQEKYLSRTRDDPALDRPTSIQLPAMSFEQTNIEYDRERKFNTLNVVSGAGTTTKVTSMYEPVPYNLEFKLYIVAKLADDALRIVEQIIPFFTPTFNLTMFPLKEKFPAYQKDIPLSLIRIDKEDTYEDNYKKRRSLTYTLTFKMNAWFFGPTSETKLIKKVFANLYDDFGVSTPAEQIIVYPGLTADGLPTNDPKQSISFRSIQATDNYGIISTIISSINADNKSAGSAPNHIVGGSKNRLDFRNYLNSYFVALGMS